MSRSRAGRADGGLLCVFVSSLRKTSTSSSRRWANAALSAGRPDPVTEACPSRFRRSTTAPLGGEAAAAAAAAAAATTLVRTVSKLNSTSAGGCTPSRASARQARGRAWAAGRRLTRHTARAGPGRGPTTASPTPSAARPRCGTPIIWTIIRHGGPNHLGL